MYSQKTTFNYWRIFNYAQRYEASAIFVGGGDYFTNSGGNE